MHGCCVIELCGILGAVVLLTVLQPSGTLEITRKPANPTIVVERVNNTGVLLVWNYSVEANEKIKSVAFGRVGLKGSTLTRIATRVSRKSFELEQKEFNSKYSASLPATLMLLDVKNSEEYTYNLVISYTAGNRSSHILQDNVSVVVFVPPKIEVEPLRKTIVDVGENLTLTCKGYGDPKPTFTWTKDGVSQSQFRTFGYDLLFSNIQIDDVGSYRCTASNGYGTDATRTSLVGLSCAVNQCQSERVNILLKNEIWKASLLNSKSDEFKALESNLASAISAAYTKKSGILFRRLNIEKFSPGSVVATVELLFDRSIIDPDPLKPLKNEMADEKLGTFTVDRHLYVGHPGNNTLTCNSCGGDAGSGDDVAFCNSRQISLPCSVKDFTNLGTTHCYTAVGRYKFLNGSQDIHTGISRGCIDCPDEEKACAALVAAFNAQFRNRTQTLDCNIKCCTGDNCNNHNVTVIPPKTTRKPSPSDRSSNSGVNVLSIQAADWKEERTTLHAVYSTVIAVLVLAVIVLVFFLWRTRSRKVSKVTQYSTANSSPATRKDTGYQEQQSDKLNKIKDYGTPLQEVATYVNTTEDAILADEKHPVVPPPPTDRISFDDGHQSFYENCDNVKPISTSMDWEVSREFVHIVKTIGKGAFAQVAKAEVWNINGIKGRATVAVKMLKENCPHSDREDLLSELELMKQLKPHPHVIKLMGCVTKSDPLLVLIEYIPYGDLLGFLRKSRGLNDTYFKDPDVKPQTTLTSQEMMQFAWQVADGMNYLSSCKIIHRDLAARNVLVGEGEKCKVTDFGMARNVNRDEIYTKHSRGRLPVKWTAYEALLYGTYTTQSDVWSFGVVLYEIFTVGGSPYPGINGREIAKKLQRGYRMPKPKHVDQHLYQLMLQCWQQKPNDRPTFSALKNKITTMMQNNNEAYVNMQEYDTSEYGCIDDLLE